MGSMERRMEVWYARGQGRKQEVLRLHGQRPAAMDEKIRPGKILVSIQPVVDGIVQAWKPIARGWMTESEVRALRDRLEADGWTFSQHRPLRGSDNSRHIKSAERIELARAKDRQRKKLMRLRSDLLRVG